MKRILLFPLLALGSIAYGQGTFGGTVQFYFSTPGGDNSRISEDQVTNNNWTGEYDIIVKNESGHSITFNQATVLLGLGSSTSVAQSAVPIAGTDTIRERFAFSGIRSFENNPNITWSPAWMSNFATSTSMAGGYEQPLNGPVRPWGLYAVMSNHVGGSMQLGANDSLALFRVSLRDNGLFASQGRNNLSLYNYPMQSGYSTTLRFIATDSTYFFDNVNSFENSRLTLIAPEPTSIVVCGLGLLYIWRRKVR